MYPMSYLPRSSIIIERILYEYKDIEGSVFNEKERGSWNITSHLHITNSFGALDKAHVAYNRKKKIIIILF